MPGAQSVAKFFFEVCETGSHRASSRVLEAFSSSRADGFIVGATPQPAQCVVSRILELARPLTGASTTGCEQLAVRSGEYLGYTVIGAQFQDQPSPVLVESAGPVDELLHHCLDPPALGWVEHRCVRPQQTALAHQAQDVHCQRSELANQIVGVELARGQALEIEVGLEFGIELLVRAVVGLPRHDLVGVELLADQAGGPALKFDLGHDQLLTAAIDVALGQPAHAAQRSGDAIVLDGLLAPTESRPTVRFEPAQTACAQATVSEA